MNNASPAHKAALTSDVQTYYARVDLLDKAENLIDRIETKVEDGSISVDKERDVRRQLNLTLDNKDNQFTWQVGGKIWLDKKIKLWLGQKCIPKSLSQITDTQAQWNQGTLLNVLATSAGSLQLAAGSPTFSRASVAYKQDGTQVAAGVPRYEVGKYGQGLMIEEGTTNLVTNAANLSTHTLFKPGAAATEIIDLGSGITNGVFRNYFQRTAATGSDQRIISSANASTYPYTITKTADYALTVEIKTVQFQSPIQFVIKGPVVDNVSNSEKIMFSINTNGTLAMSNGCTLLGDTTLSDGFRRISIKIPAAFWTGSGTTCYIVEFNGWTNLGVYDFYYRKPQLEQKSGYATSFTDGTRAAESLSIPTSLINKDEGTIEIQINPQTVQNWNNFFSMALPQAAGVNQRFLLWFNTSGIIYWDYGTWNDALQTVAGKAVVGQFVNIKLRWSAKAGTREMFVNNQLVGSRPFTPPTSLPAGAVSIASSSSYSVIIDDFRLSNKARTEAEMTNNTNAPLPVDQYTTYKLDFDNSLVASAAGQRVSPGIDLSSIAVADQNSAINWTATVPDGTSLTVETSLDLQTWDVVKNGGKIPKLTQRGLKGKFLYVRQTLITNDVTKTPSVDNLSISITSATEKDIEYVPQGVFLISSPVAKSAPDGTRQATFQGGDKWKQFDGQPRGKFTNTTTIKAGVKVADAIRSIAADGGETKFAFDPCDVVVPYDLTYHPGEARGKAMKELADLAVFSLSYDVDGYLRFRAKSQDLTTVASTWTYDKSEFTLYAGSDKELDESELYNKVLVIGGSSQTPTVSAIAQDTDSNSPISIQNIGERLFIYNNGSPDPLITTVALAQARADYELEQRAKIMERQKFAALPNYLHDAEDVITLVDDWIATNDKFELIRFNIPLKPGALMDGEAWRIRKVGA